MKKNVGIFLLGAALALGVVLAAFIVSRYSYRSNSNSVKAFNGAVRTASRTALKVSRSETIRVKGSASQTVDSDFGSWSGSVAVAAPTRQEAVIKLNEAEKSITKFIEKCGFKKEEIVWDSISVSTVHRKNEKGIDTNEIHHFEVGRSLSISSADVNNLEKLNREFTNLVKEGYSVSNHGASYIISNLDNYKMKLLEAATKNAYDRAKVITESSGGEVGSLLSASQGIFQILAPGGGDISDYGTYDKSTIRKEVKAVVTLEFNLKSKR